MVGVLDGISLSGSAPINSSALPYKLNPSKTPTIYSLFLLQESSENMHRPLLHRDLFFSNDTTETHFDLFLSSRTNKYKICCKNAAKRRRARRKNNCVVAICFKKYLEIFLCIFRRQCHMAF